MKGEFGKIASNPVFPRSSIAAIRPCSSRTSRHPLLDLGIDRLGAVCFAVKRHAEPRDHRCPAGRRHATGAGAGTDPRQEIDRACIKLIDGKRNLAEIAARLAESYSHEFPTPQLALDYVTALAERYSAA